jgi:capsid protein
MTTDHEMRMEALRLFEENERLRARIAALEAAIDEFSKATSMKDGPSLVMQRHNPTWEAWKKLCQRIGP